MNLLFFVMATLFLMAAITLTRLDSFVKLQWQSTEWKKRMVESERSSFNDSVVRCDLKANAQVNTRENSTNKGDNATTPPKKGASRGTGKLSQKWLVDPIFRKEHENNVLKALDFFRSLIQELYRHQPFYKRLEMKRPSFLEELFSELFHLSEVFKEENPQKALSLDNLLKMRWQDIELRTFFARLLQESLLYDNPPREKRGDLSEDFEINLDETREKVPYSKKGYVSIKDFLNNTTNDKLRLWLANRPILMVFFKDPAFVDSIERTRIEMFREVSKKNTPPELLETLKKRLEEEFPASKSPYGDLLDYTVTKTDPRGR